MFQPYRRASKSRSFAGVQGPPEFPWPYKSWLGCAAFCSVQLEAGSPASAGTESISRSSWAADATSQPPASAPGGWWRLLPLLDLMDVDPLLFSGSLLKFPAGVSGPCWYGTGGRNHLQRGKGLGSYHGFLWMLWLHPRPAVVRGISVSPR